MDLKTIILPLAKSTHTCGRVGPTRFQDWYRGCKTAVAIQRTLANKGTEAEILVLSNFQPILGRHEAECYTETLRSLGAAAIREIRQGYETVEQIEIAVDLAHQEGKHLIIISSPDHFPRVWWICQRMKKHADRNRRRLKADTSCYNISHKVVCGIPRPKELLTCLVLTVLYPAIDLLGGRDWWKIMVRKRRLSGTH